MAEVIDDAPRGPLLDLFAGMSAVGSEVVASRNVWCNDVQTFAFEVATAYFTSSTVRFTSSLEGAVRRHFEKNKRHMERLLARALECEVQAYNSLSTNLMRLDDIELNTSHRIKAEKLGKKQSFYNLFLSTYAGSYLGLQQSIDVDSLRYAIDEVFEQNVINADERRWMLLSLGLTLSRCSFSTGHFAQYLVVKDSSKGRYLKKRQRRVWDTWVKSLLHMRPYGKDDWRRDNKTFNQEAVLLLRDLHHYDKRPSVVYADPPYTADHFSRYYHLWETLILYDYPSVTGKGLYRSDRFSSSFSIKTQAAASIDALVKAASRLGSTFVMSYPERGLFDNSREFILKSLAASFPKVEIALEVCHDHSSFGASKGVSKAAVTEHIYIARH